MKLRSVAGAVLGALIVGVLVMPSSFGAIKAGTPCKKAGLQTVDSGRKYTCIKQGKKFVWNKGAVVKAVPVTKPAPIATATASPLPSVTPEPSPTPSPTPTFTPPARPTSFSDLLEKIDGVSYWAWYTSSEKIKKSDSSSVEVEILFGPNTPMTTHNTELAVQNVSKLYAGSVTPKRVVAIYFSYVDRPWGQATFAKYALRPQGGEANRMCQTEVTCWGALAEIDHKGTGILLMSVNDPSKVDKSHTSGPLQAHEFAHTFQSSQFTGTVKEENSYCCTKSYLPWWLVEGGATYAEAAAMNADSFESYKVWMAKSYNDFFWQPQSEFTKEWFQNFLQPAATSEWGKPEYQWKIYSVGAIVDEIFFALRGPDISMKLMRDVATGKTWPEAFEKNFGTSWNEALPVLSEALTKMIKQK